MPSETLKLYIKSILVTINQIERQRKLYNTDNNEKMVAYCDGQLKAYNDVFIKLNTYEYIWEDEL